MSFENVSGSSAGRRLKKGGQAGPPPASRQTVLQQVKDELLSNVQRSGPPAPAPAAAADCSSDSVDSPGPGCTPPLQSRPPPTTPGSCGPRQPPSAFADPYSALSGGSRYASAPREIRAVGLSTAGSDAGCSLGAAFVGNVVVHVDAGTAAERSGLYYGQRVLRIGDRESGTEDAVEEALGALTESSDAWFTVVDPPVAGRSSVTSSTKSTGPREPAVPFWAASCSIPVHEARSVDGGSEAVFYGIDVVPAAGGPAWRVFRRYNMFVALRDRLGSLAAGANFPRRHTGLLGAIEKRIQHDSGLSADQLEVRRQGLEQWLTVVLQRMDRDRKGADVLTEFLGPATTTVHSSARHRLKGFIKRRRHELFHPFGDRGDCDASAATLGWDASSASPPGTPPDSPLPAAAAERR